MTSSLASSSAPIARDAGCSTTSGSLRITNAACRVWDSTVPWWRRRLLSAMKVSGRMCWAHAAAPAAAGASECPPEGTVDPAVPMALCHLARHATFAATQDTSCPATRITSAALQDFISTARQPIAPRVPRACFPWMGRRARAAARPAMSSTLCTVAVQCGMQ